MEFKFNGENECYLSAELLKPVTINTKCKYTMENGSYYEGESDINISLKGKTDFKPNGHGRLSIPLPIFYSVLSKGFCELEKRTAVEYPKNNKKYWGDEIPTDCAERDYSKYVVFEGIFKNGIPNGKMKVYLASLNGSNSLIFYGEYHDGRRTSGTLYAFGKIIWTGV